MNLLPICYRMTPKTRPPCMIHLDAGDVLDVGVVEAMARGDAHAELTRQMGPFFDAPQLVRPLLACGGVGVTPGVQLDARRADFERGANLLRVRGDEERDADAGVEKGADEGLWFPSPLGSG